MGYKYCLGLGCKYYPDDKGGTFCFHAGFLSGCSPELKATRKRIDFASTDTYEALKALHRDSDNKENRAQAVKALGKAEGYL